MVCSYTIAWVLTFCPRFGDPKTFLLGFSAGSSGGLTYHPYVLLWLFYFFNYHFLFPIFPSTLCIREILLSPKHWHMRPTFGARWRLNWTIDYSLGQSRMVDVSTNILGSLWEPRWNYQGVEMQSPDHMGRYTKAKISELGININPLKLPPRRLCSISAMTFWSIELTKYRRGHLLENGNLLNWVRMKWGVGSNLNGSQCWVICLQWCAWWADDIAFTSSARTIYSKLRNFHGSKGRVSWLYMLSMLVSIPWTRRLRTNLFGLNCLVFQLNSGLGTYSWKLAIWLEILFTSTHSAWVLRIKQFTWILIEKEYSGGFPDHIEL